MNQENNLLDLDTEFEEKVYVIADEVLKILRELSSENKQQISSELIAEKMFWKDSVKTILNDSSSKAADNIAPSSLNEISNMILDKFTEIVPASESLRFEDLRYQIQKEILMENSEDWIDSPINIIKKYIDSLSGRIVELEEFMLQTMEYLETTKVHITGESSSNQQKFKTDRDFEDKMLTNINSIKKDCDVSRNFSEFRIALVNKMEHINISINKKREDDMLRLKETEKTLEEMRKRMAEIKREADEIRKRSSEIEFESVRDRLTGLYNKKAYDEKIIETLANLKRYDSPSSLILCDIDYFKKINDDFGDRVGNLALKKLALLLKESLRINDFISRYGEGKFAIILPFTGSNNAKKVSEGIRAYINKFIFSYKEQKISLTISVGISSLRKEDDNKKVFERADSALQLAKKSGSNMVKTENDITATIEQH